MMWPVGQALVPQLLQIAWFGAFCVPQLGQSIIDLGACGKLDFTLLLHSAYCHMSYYTIQPLFSAEHIRNLHKIEIMVQQEYCTWDRQSGAGHRKRCRIACLNRY
jgi:hypothetical protein